MLRFNLFFGLIILGLVVGCAAPKTRSAKPQPANFSALETFDAAWGIIHDTHYDTNFNGVDWEAAREEFRPRASRATTKAELRQVIQSMLDLLGQSHMRIYPGTVADVVQSPRILVKKVKGSSNVTVVRSDLPTDGPPGDLGISVRIRNGDVLVTAVEVGGPAALAGVRTGWIVQEIDGEPVRPILRLLETTPERSRFLGWQSVTRSLEGPAGSKIKIRFLDAQEHPTALELECRRLPGSPTKLGHLPTLYARIETNSTVTVHGKRVGQIHFNMFMLPIAGPFDHAIDSFRNHDGIIVDLRGNIGGLAAMVMGLGGHFTSNKVSLGILKNRSMELSFVTNPRKANPNGERVEPYQGPLAVLVDEISLSAAEIFAGGLQAIGRARVLGERTGGQALPAIMDRLPNGDVLYHVFSDFTNPKGTRLEKSGVVPDELVPLSRKSLLEGRDEVMEHALSWLDSAK
jgi:carboxyl-terminal processing protease